MSDKVRKFKCDQCLKASCCEETRACNKNAFAPGSPARSGASRCACLYRCRAGSWPFSECLGADRCGKAADSAAEPYTALAACSDAHCSDVCPKEHGAAPGAAPSDAGVGAPVSEGLAGEPIEAEPGQRYRDAAALCAAYVARSRRAIEESGGWAHLHPTPPRCREVKFPVPFRGDTTFRAARAFTLDSGLDSKTSLAIEMPGGLALTPIAWSYQNDHASLVEPLPGTLESLSIDAGALVAVVGRTEGGRDGGGAPQDVLVRGVVVCRSAESLACRGYFPAATAPLLGAKRRPWGATTSWETLAWDATPSFRFTPEGKLIVDRAGTNPPQPRQ
ncbi:MAG: hypothetical protein QM820_34225 [Minicystis sp.]